MSDSIEQIKTSFSALLVNISKPRRRLLYQQIGRELARNHRRRIKAQQAPDGSRYAPRKKQKKVKGKIKTDKMFKKLVKPKHLKVRFENEGVSLGFTGGDAAIAKIHQEGLMGRVKKEFGWKVRYAKRELLGFEKDDLKMIENFVLKAIADGIDKKGG
ncbi:phage tail protein [Pasteurellaceae bacterium LFhippo2]|nr:phage tail protein [Pasteurellaceae bacterium LFhippo2]